MIPALWLKRYSDRKAVEASATSFTNRYNIYYCHFEIDTWISNTIEYEVRWVCRRANYLQNRIREIAVVILFLAQSGNPSLTLLLF